MFTFSLMVAKKRLLQTGRYVTLCNCYKRILTPTPSSITPKIVAIDAATAADTYRMLL